MCRLAHHTLPIFFNGLASDNDGWCTSRSGGVSKPAGDSMMMIQMMRNELDVVVGSQFQPEPGERCRHLQLLIKECELEKV